MSDRSDPNARDVFELVQGESRHWVLYVKERLTSKPKDITGAKVYVTLRGRLENVTAFFTKRNAAAGGDNTQIMIRTQTGSDIGKADVYTVPADSQLIEPGDWYKFDAWVVLATGEHCPVIIDRTFVIKPAVTTSF